MPEAQAIAPKKVFTSLWVPDDLQSQIKAEAERAGVPWTRMICVLAAEALDRRKGRPA